MLLAAIVPPKKPLNGKGIHVLGGENHMIIPAATAKNLCPSGNTNQWNTYRFLNSKIHIKIDPSDVFENLVPYFVHWYWTSKFWSIREMFIQNGI